MAQANAVLTSSNSSVMAQLAQITAAMNSTQAQLKTLSVTSTNTTTRKGKIYCWSCGSDFTHGSKTCSSKKTVHKEDK